MAKGQTLKELVIGSGSTIALLTLNHILTGATGEETGWRGYLQPIFNEKYGVIKGSLLIGVIWGFWHAPLWFFTLDYTGITLEKYIVGFLVFIISLAVVMGICYERNANILIPMGIHYCMNFVVGLYTGERADIIGYLAVGYLVFAVILVFLRKRRGMMV